ncbi:HNH endonuclease [Aliiglaciecola sp. 3_MG-2023]|uniref:HNH endonuclease n=1 Tax=Aliiglaciecola sp. 3_MG-2023 TaxID=3062644 RepID=UPI0026E22176|nr:HNH endonuclease [Aliiglaciecola sp. 3_MG-2023]MDO6692162.1 HNH endonuclease [Aliiglaciecola sp. 3_MG-2023]
MMVLRLNKSGMPQAWITPEEAAKYYAQERVLFELGENKKVMLGGWNNQGVQSRLQLSSIIGCEGKVTNLDGKISLCNRYLFRRDNFLCMYCGQKFKSSQLTRDHIIPRSRGGKDIWTNAATACIRCNCHKAARTPDEAQMSLIAVPFAPNLYERFYLMNRRILADQMAFLGNHFSRNRSWLDQLL